MSSPIASFHLRAAVFSLVFVPGVAHAHINLVAPPPRHASDNINLKNGPCAGGADDMRTTDPNKITEFTAGETITIQFDETIQHPGHYRVMLSSTGDAAFLDPTGYDDVSMSPGDLIDGVQDEDSTTAHEIEVTLPNEACEECTIQLIQVMTDKAPFTAGGDDIYYQCADIVIVAGEGGGTGGAGSGGAGSGGGTGSGGVVTSAGGGFGAGGVTGSGGVVGAGGFSAAGGAPAGSGGVLISTGGAPTGAGGSGVVDPGTGASCSLQANRPGPSGGAGWLALAGLGWLVSRRRRSV